MATVHSMSAVEAAEARSSGPQEDQEEENPAHRFHCCYHR
jgi:hypothetical protein